MYLFRKPTPIIPISENLEIYLGFGYPNYVDLLNNAYKKDTTSMVKFLTINSIEGSDGYEHGTILCNLIDKVGDVFCYECMKKLSHKELSFWSSYISVGLDPMSPEKSCEFATKYNNSINYINQTELINVLYNCPSVRKRDSMAK